MYLNDRHDAGDELVSVAGEVGADDVEGGVQIDPRLSHHQQDVVQLYVPVRLVPVGEGAVIASSTLLSLSPKQGWCQGLNILVNSSIDPWERLWDCTRDFLHHFLFTFTISHG